MDVVVLQLHQLQLLLPQLVCEYDEDDKQMINTHVTMTDKFNRLRTNVIVFDVFNNDWNNGVYDKLFIFKTAWPKEHTLNIAFHNTKNGNSMHHPEIEFAYINKVKVIANILRPYGIRVYLSINFASPMALGYTKTADPLDKKVQLV